MFSMLATLYGACVITKPFEIPIPSCDNAIISVGVGSNTNFIISLDSRQGYHQVQVRKIDK